MTLAVAEPAAVEAPQTVAGLLAEANREHELCVGAAASALEHGIRAGELLLAAQECCEPGGWGKWCDENFDGSDFTAKIYMRLATHQDRIRAALNKATYTEVVQYLQEHPETKRRRRVGIGAYHSEATKAEARRLIGGGMSASAVSRQLGVSHVAVREWTDSEYFARRRARLRASRQGASKAKTGFGPMRLADHFKAVYAAHRAKDASSLEAALYELADCAVDWGEHLGRPR